MFQDILQDNIPTYYDAHGVQELAKSYRIINTPSEFAKENLFYIQEAGYLKSIKSHIKQREQLDSYLFLIVLSGEGKIKYKNHRLELRAGHCIFVDCTYHYSHQSSEENPWELMWIHFNGKHIKPYLNYYEMVHSDMMIHTDVITDFSTIIESCLNYMNINDITSEFIISKLITDLLTQCIMKKTNTSTSTVLEKMKLVKEYIDMNFQSKLSLASISEEFYISKFYLAREYKKAYGITIGDYISMKRVTHSKELLRFTSKSIEEISRICGVPDTNYYAKVFRKLEGVSPSEYRRRW